MRQGASVASAVRGSAGSGCGFSFSWRRRKGHPVSNLATPKMENPAMRLFCISVPSISLGNNLALARANGHNETYAVRFAARVSIFNANPSTHFHPLSID